MKVENVENVEKLKIIAFSITQPIILENLLIVTKHLIGPELKIHHHQGNLELKIQLLLNGVELPWGLRVLRGAVLMCLMCLFLFMIALRQFQCQFQ